MNCVGFSLLLIGAMLSLAALAHGQPLEGTQPLTLQGDIAAQMVAGIDRALEREVGRTAAARSRYWQRDYSHPNSYARSVAANRKALRAILGLRDTRAAPNLSVRHPADAPDRPALAESTAFRVYAVRWQALPDLYAEGLLLEPRGEPKADAVVLPDCDQSPEQQAGLAPGLERESQLARRLAEAGCRVLVPVLLNRDCEWSGLPGVRMTNLPHREVIWRAAFQMGRTMIGLEVEVALSAADWLGARRGTARRRLGLAGYGEGACVALYAAAVDERFDAVFISGYFAPRERLWAEPIYRNLFGVHRQFGDAEIASLVAPRVLIVEVAAHPAVPGPPPAREGRAACAAPGAIVTPGLEQVRGEWERAVALAGPMAKAGRWRLMASGEGMGPPGRSAAMSELAQVLGLSPSTTVHAPKLLRDLPDPKARMRRVYEGMLEHTQRLMRESAAAREAYWAAKDMRDAQRFVESARPYRSQFWENLIGRLPPSDVPMNARSRRIFDTPEFIGYEVMLDVYADVFAYGILLVPKAIRPGERRPVVVCQHGLEGRPSDLADPSRDDPAYHQFACKLARQGFITFAPQNPYIGGDRFRVLLRKAQPLGLTLFSYIVRQHERILDWLAGLPFVDAERMAFYGLSYGGKTAMRVPAVLERYCLSICSADYNEWVWKCASADSPYSYLLTIEYDMPEWNLANTFNYAEMSWLIAPRPFMVERGHRDGVAPDEWVAYEYARTRWHYVRLGMADRTEIEFFDGPHSIHGVGTFAFLRKWLKWPPAP